MQQIVEEVSKICGISDYIIKNDDSRGRPQKSEARRLCSDNSLAKELLGWSPKLTGLEGFQSGLKETFDWFRTGENLAKFPESSFKQ